jgi:hypothetical protein
MSKLTLGDIMDVREYERTRADFRVRVMEIKRPRRLAFGTILTVMFENRDTMHMQVQEMARVEKLVTDEQILIELDTYNPLISGDGKLCATLFLELTSDEQLREWLPRLVGIERSLMMMLPNGDAVRSMTDEDRDAQLTREHVTAAVHYIRFELTSEQIESFRSGPVRIAIDHREYLESVVLSDTTHAALLVDLTSP